jgi:hypothetical protein
LAINDKWIFLKYFKHHLILLANYWKLF